MQRMPKFVRSRLAHQTSPASNTHPDANLLAAFAEHTLLARERAEVTAHLAGCAECREYLAVACVVESPEMQVARRQAPANGVWLSQWRGLAALAACCVLAIALQHEAQPPSRTAAPKVIAVDSLSATAGSITSQVKTPELQPVRSRKKAGGQPARTELAWNKDRSVESEPPQITAPAATAPPAPVAAAAIQQLQASSDASVTQYIAPQRESTAQATAPSSVFPTALGAPAPVEAKSATHGHALGLQARLGSAALRTGALTPVAPSAAKMKTKAAAIPETPSLLWSINSSADTVGTPRGIVQRSRDAGQTWEAVPLSEHTSFHAIASDGPVVWAGGSDAALFYSSDSGAHWAQVMIVQDGVRATGAIVRIELRGPDGVRIGTSSGEDWTSSDAGRHWTRR